ncbi:UbiA prenyltransferase [Rhizorhabdus wittichii RW1]|uniref:UbiA prenyltransferase n=1 Tax=Rhizorhabdus wittichii (strain DSM 6014 / CCUG 31198 / JCM 15750 / NBRC 105917 / EY 4224 / RW1) TaxID=392499 RepID=A0A9J9LD94_RHIWR|nr:UbiA prenyltransferase [Rhizorhabdus wittichii RW1]
MADGDALPLVVDLDGTLTPADTLVESIVLLLRRSPLNLFRLILWLFGGRADFKRAVARHVTVDGAALPYNQPLLAWLREQKAQGRRIILATAAHGSIAEQVQRHLGLFDLLISTADGENMKGRAKLAAIRAAIGDRFAYVGNGGPDMQVWAGSDAAIAVDVPAGELRRLRAAVPIEREFRSGEGRLGLWLRALRVHQWTKNALLFVPLLTAFSFLDIGKTIDVLLAFVAFSLVASASYVLNDIVDLENDRAHPRKSERPFASGRLPLLHGVALAIAGLVAGVLVATAVSWAFVLMLLSYLALTSAYSWTLKQYVLIDVLTLSLLYSWRIMAGAVAIDVRLSSWLLAFSVFVFLSLALIKRCTELLVAQGSGRAGLRGRDYRTTDLAVLWPLGAGSALSSVVIFGLFISSPETAGRYASPELLWLAAFGLIYWLGRMWVKTSRGEMHDDPIVYSFKDRGSRIALAGIIAVMIAARFVHVVVLHG